MSKITLQVEQDEFSGWYVASWDDPAGKGGLTTEGWDLPYLQLNVGETVRCYFERNQMPQEIHLHFVADPILTLEIARDISGPEVVKALRRLGFENKRWRICQLQPWAGGACLGLR